MAVIKSISDFCQNSSAASLQIMDAAHTKSPKGSHLIGVYQEKMDGCQQIFNGKHTTQRSSIKNLA